MRSFEGDFLRDHPVSPLLIRTIGEIRESKGREELYSRQSPQLLETLRRVAVIESTEASNRIEGITAPMPRIRALVTERSEPRNRSEQEIAGYRDVLDTIHTRHADIPFTPGVVLQFHRDLHRFLPAGDGRWKPVDSEITEERPDGRRIVRFTPVPAHQTPEAMKRLHAGFHGHAGSGEIEPLLLIGAYALDFLCIHPFLDGNGRMARLLSLLLLYRFGFGVGRYISLEHLIERTREGYYESLHASSQRWHDGRHTLTPWWEYFLGVVLLGAYRELEERVGSVAGQRGAKRMRVVAAIERQPAVFRYRDVASACPDVSRPTIQRVFDELREAGRIRRRSFGRNATWEKLDQG